VAKTESERHFGALPSGLACRTPPPHPDNERRLKSTHDGYADEVAGHGAKAVHQSGGQHERNAGKNEEPREQDQPPSALRLH